MGPRVPLCGSVPGSWLTSSKNHGSSGTQSSPSSLRRSRPTSSSHPSSSKPVVFGLPYKKQQSNQGDRIPEAFNFHFPSGNIPYYDDPIPKSHHSHSSTVASIEKETTSVINLPEQNWKSNKKLKTTGLGRGRSAVIPAWMMKQETSLLQDSEKDWSNRQPYETTHILNKSHPIIGIDQATNLYRNNVLNEGVNSRLEMERVGNIKTFGRGRSAVLPAWLVKQQPCLLQDAVKHLPNRQSNDPSEISCISHATIEKDHIPTQYAKNVIEENIERYVRRLMDLIENEQYCETNATDIRECLKNIKYWDCQPRPKPFHITESEKVMRETCERASKMLSQISVTEQVLNCASAVACTTAIGNAEKVTESQCNSVSVDKNCSPVVIVIDSDDDDYVNEEDLLQNSVLQNQKVSDHDDRFVILPSVTTTSSKPSISKKSRRRKRVKYNKKQHGGGWNASVPMEMSSNIESHGIHNADKCNESVQLSESSTKEFIAINLPRWKKSSTATKKFDHDQRTPNTIQSPESDLVNNDIIAQHEQAHSGLVDISQSSTKKKELCRHAAKSLPSWKKARVQVATTLPTWKKVNSNLDRANLNSQQFIRSDTEKESGYDVDSSNILESERSRVLGLLYPRWLPHEVEQKERLEDREVRRPSDIGMVISMQSDLERPNTGSGTNSRYFSQENVAGLQVISDQDSKDGSDKLSTMVTNTMPLTVKLPSWKKSSPALATKPFDEKQRTLNAFRSHESYLVENKTIAISDQDSKDGSDNVSTMVTNTMPLAVKLPRWKKSFPTLATKKFDNGKRTPTVFRLPESYSVENKTIAISNQDPKDGSDNLSTMVTNPMPLTVNLPRWKKSSPALEAKKLPSWKSNSNAHRNILNSEQFIRSDTEKESGCDGDSSNILELERSRVLGLLYPRWRNEMLEAREVTRPTGRGAVASMLGSGAKPRYCVQENIAGLELISDQDSKDGSDNLPLNSCSPVSGAVARTGYALEKDYQKEPRKLESSISGSTLQRFEHLEEVEFNRRNSQLDCENEVKPIDGDSSEDTSLIVSETLHILEAYNCAPNGISDVERKLCNHSFVPQKNNRDESLGLVQALSPGILMDENDGSDMDLSCSSESAAGDVANFEAGSQLSMSTTDLRQHETDFFPSLSRNDTIVIDNRHIIKDNRASLGAATSQESQLQSIDLLGTSTNVQLLAKTHALANTEAYPTTNCVQYGMEKTLQIPETCKSVANEESTDSIKSDFSRTSLTKGQEPVFNKPKSKPFKKQQSIELTRRKLEIHRQIVSALNKKKNLSIALPVEENEEEESLVSERIKTKQQSIELVKRKLERHRQLVSALQKKKSLTNAARPVEENEEEEGIKSECIKNNKLSSTNVNSDESSLKDAIKPNRADLLKRKAELKRNREIEHARMILSQKRSLLANQEEQARVTKLNLEKCRYQLASLKSTKSRCKQEINRLALHKRVLDDLMAEKVSLLVKKRKVVHDRKEKADAM